MTDPWLRDAGAVARDLGVNPQQGLPSAEAARRLAQHGPNTLRGAPPRPAWRRLLAQFQDPLGYLLLAAILIFRGARDVITVLLLGVSLAVAAVPEGLPAILSVVLALGVRRMAAHKAARIRRPPGRWSAT